jgi:ribonucleoside-diphosphate reductase alpha subunit
MEVIKRSGKVEGVFFDKITKRISKFCDDLDKTWIDPIKIAQDTIKNMYNHITTRELDLLSADICASQIHYHPDFNKLGARILVSNLHKTTHENYLDACEGMFAHELLSEQFMKFVRDNAGILQLIIDYERDFLFDYFGFKTLERSYLFRVKEGDKTVTLERPQHMWMRVAIQIHGLHDEGTVGEKLALVQRTYDAMSQLYFTHATPTLFNSGTNRPQMSSCFLMTAEDSLDHIFESFSNIGQISKFAGGIGISLSQIRCKNSHIKSTNGKSQGIIPMCKVLESIARYVNQAGKRNGSIACYLEPWHADVLDFVELRKNTGDENLRTRDLFISLYVNDLFMERLMADADWSLFCPSECPLLYESYGEKFNEAYLEYERQGKARRVVKAKELWQAIMDSQIETGMPYIVYKDAVNTKCNQKNLGTINCSNLCAEITEYSSKDEISVCNLGSMCLPRFVGSDGQFDYEKLGEYVEVLTENLDKVIDLNYYPVSETRTSNSKHRPIGLGVQGLADVYIKMQLAFDSDEAREVNRKIFETIYFHALKKSNERAVKLGAYSSFQGSPFSQGQLQYHLWGVEPTTKNNWKELVENIVKSGTRNSLLTALMPTASTSQIMGSNECFEPITSNIYVRKTLSGEFIVASEHLVRDLVKLDLWSKEMYEEIIYYNGSVQNIARIPENIKKMYRTAFELPQISIVRQAVERGPFVDQTQSMNIFMAKPDFDKLSKCLTWGWKNGLKTGCYYLRTLPTTDAIKFGLDPDAIKRIKQSEAPACVFVRKGQPIPEGCDVCSA